MVKKIIITLLALLAVGQCNAQFGFFIDNISLYCNEVGGVVEVPVKARFGTQSSACYIHIQFPEGVYPVSVEDDEGDELYYAGKRHEKY